MKINSIIINNVKGITHLEINQTIYPNRPNILVAPNGFGKTSIATAFKSLKSNRIVLKQEDLLNGNQDVIPNITLSLTTGQKLTANNISNDLTTMFNIFVINSQLSPKAKVQRFGKAISAKASLFIEPTIIYNTIPPKESFSYNYNSIKKLFGKNGRILFDISSVYSHCYFLKKVERKINFNAFKLPTFKERIKEIIEKINSLSGKSIGDIKQKITDDFFLKLKQKDFLCLARMIKDEANYENNVDSFLSAWQYIIVRETMKGTFNKALDYAIYKKRKEEINKTLDNLNPVKERFKIVSKEIKRSLVIEWPQAHLISSGQRDIMVFIAKLMECEYQSSKKHVILIIDEFFDYLDDANVVAFQYYISTLIDSFKREKRLLFPILLTHLDPNYLKHFCFNDKRLNVCYLKIVNCIISKEMRNLVDCRDNELISNYMDKYYFHYHPNCDTIDISAELDSLSLNSAWGTPFAFRKKIDRECRKYLYEPNRSFDPLAVCLSVRQKIEELVYAQLDTKEVKEGFLDEHGTNKKLDYAHEHGVSFPETYHLLSIIYNPPLHSSGDLDLSKPLGIKLDNTVIKNMIMRLWQE